VGYYVWLNQHMLSTEGISFGNLITLCRRALSKTGTLVLLQIRPSANDNGRNRDSE
jgi:hypothetical protein